MTRVLILSCCLLFAACTTTQPDPDPFEGCPEYVPSGDPQPTTFDIPELLLGIDILHSEYEAGTDFMLLDVRPGSDYALHTITGAQSLPYYEAAGCVDELPQDSWIITFCACPHSLSSNVANTLMGEGFTKVKVLDEGYLEWRERNYSTTDNP